MGKVKRLLPRSRVKSTDTWDLGSLYPDDATWQRNFKKWETRIGHYASFRGQLRESADKLAACLKFHLDFDRAGERLGTYAFLKTAEDTANSTYQAMIGRFRNAASRAAQAASYIDPEIMAIPQRRMKQLLADRKLAPYRLLIERLLRYRPHTLSDSEERLLAMGSEVSDAANRIFRQLNDADLKFGTVRDENGDEVELSHSTFAALLQSPKREVRRNAFHTYYDQFEGHDNTLAATLSASIDRDVFYARARNFRGALDRALFADDVPQSVYDNLIAAVHRHLPSLYRYYDLRRRKMKLRRIHHYDTYVPILCETPRKRDWRQAVKLVTGALAPLGSEYCGMLERGLSGRWCDRYANVGKQSGAFSCGSFDGDPYILMNYQPTVLDHVFTLAHEAGHSMHSYYSAANQPYAYYNYTIFVAEVASTFNEQLLSDHMLAQARDDHERAVLLNREIDAIRATIIRQTMFAEFEKRTHEQAEADEPLTLAAFKTIYRELLERYFGPDFSLDDELELECLRIPHFYRAFYVYKYATGMSAAIALAERVSRGGRDALDAYLGFLKAGCSKFPLDLLRDAGVDMERPEPVDTALERFARLVDELDSLL